MFWQYNNTAIGFNPFQTSVAFQIERKQSFNLFVSNAPFL